MEQTPDTKDTESFNESTQFLLGFLPVLQRSCATLAEKECQQHGYAPTDVLAVVDINLPASVGIRIEPDATPVIRVSAAWAYEILLSTDSSALVYGIQKAVRVAYKQFRWTLGRNKPRNAAEYVLSARRFRLTNPESFSLPVTNFRCRLVVEMIDPMTGETVRREHVKSTELDTVCSELAHELTGLVFAHEQVADLLDTLQAHKDAAKDDTIVAMDIKTYGKTYSITSLHYNTVGTDE